MNRKKPFGSNTTSNVNFDSQKTPHPMVTALRRQIQWVSRSSIASDEFSVF